MKRVLSHTLPRPGRSVELSESEAKHVIQVLRLRNGSSVEVLDGKGSFVRAILKIRGKAVWVETSMDPRMSLTGQSVPVYLELTVLKGDAMEWAIEKAVELGVKALIPVLTERTVVQLDKKGPNAFQERWQKIADQALKQCGRLERMPIHMPLTLENLVTSTNPTGPRLWLDEEERKNTPFLQNWLQTSQPLKELHLLVGPEGGWSEREREFLSDSKGTVSVSLGPLVLRAETAALYATSLSTAYFRTLAQPN
jgi:16S rRNA (uracil1498-N3)-methyltransferase